MPNASATTRVLVVDDDPGVASVLRRGLAREGYVIEAATDGEEALRRVVEWMPDLVILDVLMPGLDGIEVCHRVRALDAKLPVLMLTAKDGAQDQIVGLDAGADDYLVKPFTLGVLAARVRALLRRRDPSAGEILHFEDLELDTGSHVARRKGREVHLTRTEYRLLREFLLHPGQLLSKEQLTEEIWRYDFAGNYNVLEVYVRYLRTKLEEAGECRLIHTLRGSGYILRATAP